ncbi:hypothetical protein BIW11_00078, partial [Tropilaelaps mercedesae]
MESVFVVHRHSVRAPTYFPERDPFFHCQAYPRGAGYLTTKGIRACEPVVFVRSSESPRCHETAQAILAALFNTQESISPVPVYGPPPGFDTFVSLEGYNKDINIELRKHFQDPVTQPNTLNAKTLGDVMETVKNAMVVPATSEYEAFTFLDGMISNIYEGFSLPDFWTQNERILTEVYQECYTLVIEQYRPYYAGYLLRNMGERMKQVVN